MKQALFITIAALALLAIGTSTYSYMHTKSETDAVSGSDAPEMQQKVAASEMQDGEYYVRIESVSSNPEDTVLTFKHVSYFEGEEARLSAEQEVKCEGNIEDCVPTLEDGYYVRESGAPTWAAPLATNANIDLSNDADAEIADFVSYANDAENAVYVVTIENGQAVKVREVTG